jgi:hypothetical protein
MIWFWFKGTNGNWLVSIGMQGAIWVTTFYHWLARDQKYLKVPIRHFDIYECEEDDEISTSFDFTVHIPKTVQTN